MQTATARRRRALGNEPMYGTDGEGGSPAAAAAGGGARPYRIGVLDKKVLLDTFEEEGINRKHVATVERYVVKNGVGNFDEIPGLSKKAYKILQEKFVVSSSSVESELTSSDGSTTKLLICLYDGKKVEAVIMRYGAVELASFPEHLQKKDSTGAVQFKSTKRATLCVSSQVGCAMACTFCATGTMGHVGNLTAGEILEQLLLANRIDRIRNVVFMGMGEPLDNYEEVIEAIRGMKDVRRFNLSGHHISLSTVGVAPRIRQLATDARDISLAVSLHAPNQRLRQRLLPSAKAWSIKRIMEAIDFFILRQNEVITKSQQFVLVQYILIADENDSHESAEELGELLVPRSRHIMVNVIPYNPTDSPVHYMPPSQDAIDRFVAVLRRYNLRVSIRQELGQDISSACGQLVIKSEESQAIEQLSEPFECSMSVESTATDIYSAVEASDNNLEGDGDTVSEGRIRVQGSLERRQYEDDRVDYRNDQCSDKKYYSLQQRLDVDNNDHHNGLLSLDADASPVYLRETADCASSAQLSSSWTQAVAAASISFRQPSVGGIPQKELFLSVLRKPVNTFAAVSTVLCVIGWIF